MNKFSFRSQCYTSAVPGVSDKSTRHIQEMVTYQRMTKSEKTKLESVRRSAVIIPRNRRSPPPLPLELKRMLYMLLSYVGL